jgi:fatty acid amide hydrolase 2
MNIHTASLHDLAAALRTGATTPSDLLEAHIARIEEVNPLVNGMAAPRYEKAREEAQLATERLAAGGDDLPPLVGIPCTIKEFIGVEGMPQSGGVLWRKDAVAEQDATVVSRLRKAGAIVMGVTNIPEGGLWLETYNSIYGRTNNPWNTKRTSGGSSGGEGALVATGASPFGIGSDVGGSIRIPAAFCGTVGHKPTGGLVPNTGHYPEGALTEPGGRFLSVGPLARSVDDAWLVLKIIAGEDGLDKSMKPYSLGDPDSVKPSDLVVYPLADNGRTSVHRDVRRAIVQSTQALEEAGATIEYRTFPNLKRAFEIWSAMLTEGTAVPYSEILGEHGPLNPFAELGRMCVGSGRHTFAAVFMCVADRIAAALPKVGKHFVEVGEALQEELETAMSDNGVILHPPYNRPPPPHWDAFRTPFAPAYTAIFNVMEFPVTQIPAGFSKNGLPVGVQVVSSRGHDHLTIAAARIIERALGGWKMAQPD